MAAGEIGIGFRRRNFGYRTFDAYLPAQALPVEKQCNLGIGRKFPALPALEIGVEHEAIRAMALSRTMRTEGAASGVAVASAMAFGSLGSLAFASANHASKMAKGSDAGMACSFVSVATAGFCLFQNARGMSQMP